MANRAICGRGWASGRITLADGQGEGAENHPTRAGATGKVVHAHDVASARGIIRVRDGEVFPVPAFSRYKPPRALMSSACYASPMRPPPSYHAILPKRKVRNDPRSDVAQTFGGNGGELREFTGSVGHEALVSRSTATRTSSRPRSTRMAGVQKDARGGADQ
jgi:hypothetical protein